MSVYVSYITGFIESNRVKEFKSISFINPTSALCNIEISLALVPVDFVKQYILHDGYKEVKLNTPDIVKTWERTIRIPDDAHCYFVRKLFQIVENLLEVTRFFDGKIEKIYVSDKGLMISFEMEEDMKDPTPEQVMLIKNLIVLGGILENPNSDRLLSEGIEEGKTNVV